MKRTEINQEMIEKIFKFNNEEYKFEDLTLDALKRHDVKYYMIPMEDVWFVEIIIPGADYLYSCYAKLTGENEAELLQDTFGFGDLKHNTKIIANRLRELASELELSAIEGDTEQPKNPNPPEKQKGHLMIVK